MKLIATMSWVFFGDLIFYIEESQFWKGFRIYQIQLLICVWIPPSLSPLSGTPTLTLLYFLMLSLLTLRMAHL